MDQLQLNQTLNEQAVVGCPSSFHLTEQLRWDSKWTVSVAKVQVENYVNILRSYAPSPNFYPWLRFPSNWQLIEQSANSLVRHTYKDNWDSVNSNNEYKQCNNPYYQRSCTMKSSISSEPISSKYWVMTSTIAKRAWLQVIVSVTSPTTNQVVVPYWNRLGLSARWNFVISISFAFDCRL